MLIKNNKKKKIIIRESKLTDIEYEIDKDNKGQIEIEKKEIERKKLIKIILFLWILSIIGFFSFYAEEYFLEVDYYYAQGSVRIFFEISNFDNKQINEYKEKENLGQESNRRIKRFKI